MKYNGEHLFPGQLGHFLAVLSFVASIVATISFLKAARTNILAETISWKKRARVAFCIETISVFGIFFTPIFFEPSMLGARGAHLAMLNPLTGILEGLRPSVVQGHNLVYPLRVVVKGVERPVWEPWELVYSGVCAIVAVFGAALMFRRLQHLFAEYV